jgi:hypothetical protein
MREGNSNAVADGVMKRPSVLDASKIKNKTSGKIDKYNRQLRSNTDSISIKAPANVQNIYLYRAYLDERIITFRHLKRDYAAKRESRLRHLKVSEGLLKETSALQRQMESVLKCKVKKDGNMTCIKEDVIGLFLV